MSNVLNQAPNAHVFHEPVTEDFFAHTWVHYFPSAAYSYMHGFRKKEIFFRMRHVSSGIYGEVNSILRCHASAIKGAFPKATVIHLVRDGRDVVRSTASRQTMTIRDPFTLSLRPAKSDPWRSHWRNMNRFARICWYWQEENRRLREGVGRIVQFEKILSSYEYFLKEVLEPCHIHVDKSVWTAAAFVPQNTSRRFSMPKWEQWSLEEQNTFRTICGNEMIACGYEF